MAACGRTQSCYEWLRGVVSTALVDAPDPLTAEEQSEWLSQRTGLALASDGLIPFRDNIDCAAQHGVAYMWQPGGSARDDEVIRAADEHGMVMCVSGQRLFHH
jgi:phosphoribosylaminoimidazolecarboxamide formyltransferase/IMP cyclohydrolase